MKIAVIGSINMDITVTSQRIPKKGETLQGESVHYIPGGKGANQAVAMAHLGAEVEMFGCVGDDSTGESLLKNLQKEGIETGAIQKVSGTPTGIAMITVGENDNTIVVVAGANGKVDIPYIKSIEDRLKEFKMVVLQHEIPLETVHYIVAYCHANEIPVILNPAPAADVPQNIIDQVSFLTPNEHETSLIFGDDKSTEELLKQYPEKLIITQGSRGVSVGLKNGEICLVPARKVNVVDTTGAGDTLNGAFAFRIAAGDDIVKALKYANVAASLSIGRFGAQGGMPTNEEVEAILKK